MLEFLVGAGIGIALIYIPMLIWFFIAFVVYSIKEFVSPTEENQQEGWWE